MHGPPAAVLSAGAAAEGSTCRTAAPTTRRCGGGATNTCGQHLPSARPERQPGGADPLHVNDGASADPYRVDHQQPVGAQQGEGDRASEESNNRAPIHNGSLDPWGSCYSARQDRNRRGEEGGRTCHQDRRDQAHPRAPQRHPAAGAWLHSTPGGGTCTRSWRTTPRTTHYNHHRPHRARNLRPPDCDESDPALITDPARASTRRLRVLGGLIYEYELAA